jgi:hypothetical protein
MQAIWLAVMIKVQLPDEPDDFFQRVKSEGLAHLQEQEQDPDQPVRDASIWNRRALPDGRSETPDYWRRAREAVQRGYSNRCVYSCFKLEDESFPGGNRYGGQVDHFMPRASSAAKLAYEWKNLRWAWGKIDSDYKGNNVIPSDHDPVQIKEDSLILEEDGNGDLVVVPNPHLQEAEKARLKETIQMLGLNRKPIVLARNTCFDDFIDPTNSYDPAFMEEVQPFVYQQMIA